MSDWKRVALRLLDSLDRIESLEASLTACRDNAKELAEERNELREQLDGWRKVIKYPAGENLPPLTLRCVHEECGECHAGKDKCGCVCHAPTERSLSQKGEVL